MTIQENIDLIYAELMRIKLSLGGESGDVSEEIAELNDAVAALEVKDAAQDGKIADNTRNINNIDKRESAHYSGLSSVMDVLNSQIYTNAIDISDNIAGIAALEADKSNKLYLHNIFFVYPAGDNQFAVFISKLSTEGQAFTKENLLSKFISNEVLIINGNYSSNNIFYSFFSGIKTIQGFTILVNRNNSPYQVVLNNIYSVTSFRDTVIPL